MVNLDIRPGQMCAESSFRLRNSTKSKRIDQLLKNTKHNTLERWAHYIIIVETREEEKRQDETQV